MSLPKRGQELGWWVIGFGASNCFFGLQESSSETRVHRVKGLSGLGKYGIIGSRNCIKKFILRRRNNSFFKAEGKK